METGGGEKGWPCKWRELIDQAWYAVKGPKERQKGLLCMDGESDEERAATASLVFLACVWKDGGCPPLPECLGQGPCYAATKQKHFSNPRLPERHNHCVLECTPRRPAERGAYGYADLFNSNPCVGSGLNGTGSCATTRATHLRHDYRAGSNLSP
jgi:hypothetical protein